MNFLWEKVACEAGKVYTCSVAQLRFWLMRNEQGWLTAFRHEPESVFEPLRPCEPEPPTLEWQRFVTPSAAAAIRLVPVLPDLAVMSHPEARIEIAPRHKGLFFVTVPVWLSAKVEAAHPVTVCEHPTRVMSKTWFGLPADEGEIGYALTTRARQALSELTDVEGRAICPVLIENNTSEALVFAQLLLRVNHMSVYQTKDGRLWTNECKLGYAGSIFPASLTFGRSAPAQAKHSALLSGPREPPASGLTARVITDTVFKQPF